jgi:hypothetical protein
MTWLLYLFKGSIQFTHSYTYHISQDKVSLSQAKSPDENSTFLNSKSSRYFRSQKPGCPYYRLFVINSSHFRHLIVLLSRPFTFVNYLLLLPSQYHLLSVSLFKHGFTIVENSPWKRCNLMRYLRHLYM